MKKTFLSLIFLLLQQLSSFPQNQENIPNTIENSLENTLFDSETEFDFESLIEELLFLSENKININTAQRTDLQRIPFLSEKEIYGIIQHIRKYGKILSFYELKNVPELEKEKIEQILPFITIESTEKLSFKKCLQKSKNQLLVRYDRILQKKKGYRDKKYVGSPDQYYFKYSFQGTDKIYFGLTGEKDAGEQFWGKYNKGFDFYSFYLQLSNIHVIKNWIFGDFKIDFGQGLVIGSNSIIGKSDNVLNSMQKRQGIHKYSSTRESSYFRGSGGTLSIKKTDISIFYSNNKIDANLSEDEKITSFKTDGLHRTEKEIEKKRNTGEIIKGGNICFRERNLCIGGTFIHYQYDKNLQPAEKSYNLYKIQKTDNHWNGSLDYMFDIRKMNLFGELAYGKKDGYAILNGINIYPSSRLGILIIHRYYSPTYQANYANGFSENSRIENETGIYIGTEFKPFKKFKISTYMDSFRFPWIKYNTDRPSFGTDLLVSISYLPFKNLTVYSKYKYKQKEETNINTLRYGIKNKINNQIELHTIINGNYYTQTQKSSYGWLIAQDLSYTLTKIPLNVNFRYAYFEVPDYDNRLYLYEKDILYAFSIPAYYGIGHRLYFNIRWQPTTSVTCYLKTATYIYSDGRETTGNGQEEIKGNLYSSVKCLIRYKF